VVGHNPKKSGKFLSAPLIFPFPYAHAGKVLKLPAIAGSRQLFRTLWLAKYFYLKMFFAK
jgi:hypothetical protein